jgi:hypothetical protein
MHTRARQVLRKLLAEPMRFEPVVADGRKTYRISGNMKVGALLDPNYTAMASPRGLGGYVVGLRLPLAA